MTFNRADAVLAFASDRYEIFHDPSGEPWVWHGDEAIKLGTGPFGELLGAEFHAATGLAVSKQTLSGTINTLRGKARLEGDEVPVWLRIGHIDGNVVVDLADGERNVVVISADGYAVTTASPGRFYRPNGMLPLPIPEPGGSLADLASCLPLSDDELVLVVGWIVGCFAPSGSKPLLDLSGTQGSGKTILATFLRGLVDPNATLLQTLPDDFRNLAVLVSRHAVPVFDNVSEVNRVVSDGLCRLASGMGFDHRRLYTDDDVISFVATRSMILTGIPELARQGDLGDRTMSIFLPRMSPDQRRTEAELREAFEAVRPRILGFIFGTVSCALRRLDRVNLSQAPRMYDFARFVEAGAPSLGWEEGRFLRAYITNRKEMASAIIEGSVVGRFVPKLVPFTGSASECLSRLDLLADTQVRRSKGWPSSPAGLEGILRRLAPGFAEEGIDLAFERHRGRRIIRIEKQASRAEVIEMPSLWASTRVSEVAQLLRACDVDSSTPPRTAARLATKKAVGDCAVAAEALNVIGVPTAAEARTWTSDLVRDTV